jgi:hypothetical protein
MICTFTATDVTLQGSTAADTNGRLRGPRWLSTRVQEGFEAAVGTWTSRTSGQLRWTLRSQASWATNVLFSGRGKSLWLLHSTHWHGVARRANGAMRTC